MLQQWLACKQKAGDALVLFRLGDFYEAFEEDASVLARELEITLTARHGVPMAGIPWMALESSIDRLVGRGLKVAIAEQVEEPRSKGIMRREIVRLVSPGTLIQSGLLQEKRANFLACCFPSTSRRWGLAACDLSTGEFLCTELESEEELWNELGRLKPAELIIPAGWLQRHPQWRESCEAGLAPTLTPQQESHFELTGAENFLSLRFEVTSWKALGLEDSHLAAAACLGLVRYVEQMFPALMTTLGRPHLYQLSELLHLDRQTLRHLAILEDAPSQHHMTLFGVLDHTETPMGGRMLGQWLRHPLAERAPIEERQQAITQLLQRQLSLHGLRGALKGIRDLERLGTRLASGLGAPRDLGSLRDSLMRIPGLIEQLLAYQHPLLQRLAQEATPPQALLARLQDALSEEMPAKAGEGGCFRTGYHAEYDRLMVLSHQQEQWVETYQETLRSETGIKSLKLGQHQSFGWFIEVPRSQANLVPQHFQRRQTLTSGERFVTDELKAFERDLLVAKEQLRRLELHLISELKAEVQTHIEAIRRSAQAVGTLDVLASLAVSAHRNGWSCPEIIVEDHLEIQAGRHPIIEQAIPLGQFIPNDLLLTPKKRLMVLTGPNMGGKSTYMRQIGLLVIMAQIGSFVPAKKMRWSLLDRIFTRIGASDDLARGQSTFMVEMVETAAILHQATAHSLVLLDEIGRGTSTSDGLAIAWAVAEYLLEGLGKGAKTLFATHFLELTQMAALKPGAFNAHVTVQEQDGAVTFLHRIKPGAADRAYGLHVARIAGVPATVVKRAVELQQNFDRMSQRRLMPQSKPVEVLDEQPGLFAALSSDPS